MATLHRSFASGRSEFQDDVRAADKFDLNALLHPAQAFAHPDDVVNDPDLTRNEKRAILASWASDACAVEAAPGLRQAPPGPPVQFDDIIEALRRLDHRPSFDRRTERPGLFTRRGASRWRARASDPRRGVSS